MYVVWVLHHHDQNKWSNSSNFRLRMHCVDGEITIRPGWHIISPQMVFLSSGRSSSWSGLNCTSRRPRSSKPKPNVIVVQGWTELLSSSSAKRMKSWALSAWPTANFASIISCSSSSSISWTLSICHGYGDAPCCCNIYLQNWVILWQMLVKIPAPWWAYGIEIYRNPMKCIWNNTWDLRLSSSSTDFSARYVDYNSPPSIK